MRITPTLAAPLRIVLVDDVVTKGATLLAAASLIHAAFPDTRVEAFALVRTLGLQPEVQRIVDPVVGTITLNPWAGADRRP
jgi:adenine/guanine phosphoribosyltransferase-like PRPP-binding protein